MAHSKRRRAHSRRRAHLPARLTTRNRPQPLVSASECHLGAPQSSGVAGALLRALAGHLPTGQGGISPGSGGCWRSQRPAGSVHRSPWCSSPPPAAIGRGIVVVDFRHARDESTAEHEGQDSLRSTAPPAAPAAEGPEGNGRLQVAAPRREQPEAPQPAEDERGKSPGHARPQPRNPRYMPRTPASFTSPNPIPGGYTARGGSRRARGLPHQLRMPHPASAVPALVLAAGKESRWRPRRAAALRRLHRKEAHPVREQVDPPLHTR